MMARTQTNQSPKFVTNIKIESTKKLEEWLPTYLQHIKEDITLNSYNSYYSYIHAHILPQLGRYLLAELTAPIIKDFAIAQLKEGRLDGTGGLSAKTVNEYILILKQALDQAVIDGEMPYNPCYSISLPRIEKEEIHALGMEEQARMEEQISPVFQPNSDLCVKLGLYGGLRIGEVCALTIEDVDFDKKRINVSKTLYRARVENGLQLTQIQISSTKNKKQRYVPLCEELDQDLRTYFESMHEKQRENKKAPLFINSKGQALEPRTMLYHFNRLLKRSNIEHARFHDLRHTFASRCLEVGIELKIVSKILGHSSTKITADLYTHVSPQMMGYAIAKLKKENWENIYK